MTQELIWGVRRRPGVGSQFAKEEQQLDVKVGETLVLDLGDYRFLIRRSIEGLRVSTERGRDMKGHRIALRISQPNEIILWGEFAAEPNMARYPATKQ